MGAFIVIASVVAVIGIAAGAFLTISFAIRRDDWAMARGFNVPGRAARSARLITGYRHLQ
jgi:hypothetical protein